MPAKGREWQLVLGLLSPMAQVKVEVTFISSLSQRSGFAIGMCVTIGGCVIVKISETSLHPEEYIVFTVGLMS